MKFLRALLEIFLDVMQIITKTKSEGIGMEAFDKLKELPNDLADEILEMGEQEGKAFLEDNKDDLESLGKDAANQLLMWARFEFTDIPLLPEDPSMQDSADLEAILAKRDGVFKKMAKLEKSNAEVVARMKAKAKSFMARIGEKLGQKGLKYLTMALIALV